MEDNFSLRIAIANSAKYVEPPDSCKRKNCLHYDAFVSCHPPLSNWCPTCKRVSTNWTPTNCSNLMSSPRYANRCDDCGDAFWMPEDFSPQQIQPDPSTPVLYYNGNQFENIKFKDLGERFGMEPREITCSLLCDECHVWLGGRAYMIGDLKIYTFPAFKSKFKDDLVHHGQCFTVCVAQSGRIKRIDYCVKCAKDWVQNENDRYQAVAHSVADDR